MTTEQKHSHINTNDRRVKRTKRALREALFELLDKKSINQISVTELTDIADVNRATFYFYYEDTVDMLEQIQNEVYVDFEQLIKDAGNVSATESDMVGYLKNILLYIKQDPVMCRFVLENDVNHNLQKKIQALMISVIPNSEAVYPADKPAHFATKYALNGIIGCIIAWLTEGMTADIDELAAFMASMYIHGSVATLKN